MKKMILSGALAALALALTVNAADNAAKLLTWTTISWHPTLAECQEALSNETNLRFKFRLECLAELAQRPPTTFAEFTAAIDRVAATSTWLAKYTPEQQVDTVIDTKLYFPYGRGEFLTDAWAFCNNGGDGYFWTYWRIEYLLRFAKELKLTPQDRYTYLKSYLLGPNAPLEPKLTFNALGSFIELAADHDPAEVKGVLTTLNRKFTKMLLNDKAKWEPVIAVIRSTLETY